MAQLNELKRMQQLAGLITESQLNEALNKDIKAFGQDLDKRFKEAGFDTLITMQKPSAQQSGIIKSNPKAVMFEVFQTPEIQQLTLYVNPKQIQKAESIINKFQLSDYDGPVLKRGWTAKQVKGAINPGDIVKQDTNKAMGLWYFYRLPKVDTKVNTLESQLNEDWVEIAKMVGPAVAIAAPAMLAFKGLMKSAKDNIVTALKAKGQPIPDAKTLEQLAVKALTGEMNRVTGAGASNMAEGDIESAVNEALNAHRKNK
jgi:hypothetical protein